MSKFSKNQIIKVIVNSIKPYGVFVLVDDEYVGLIHISQINGKYINNINDYFKIGEEIKAKILEIDEDKKQLKLSTVNLKQYHVNNKKLPETSLGFDLFEEILQDWIDEKLDEIEKNIK